MSVVPVIIPFYREHEKLKKCLAAIAAQSHPGCEPFVRDNTHDNILYTAAVNEGLARYGWRQDVKYLVVLNQDAYMQPDCVRQLVDFMEAQPECGIACPLQFAEASGQLPRRVSWGGSLDAFPAGRHRHDDFASYREPFETFWANGACMMIRAEVLREIGVFDRNLRFICSDADYSFTARSRGWKVFVVPRALAEHTLAASARTVRNPHIEMVKSRDVVYFTEKWLTGDLYRRLASEGASLTRAGVRQELDRMRRSVHILERESGAPSTRPPELIPSWVTAMQTVGPPIGKGRF